MGETFTVMIMKEKSRLQSDLQKEVERFVELL